MIHCNEVRKSFNQIQVLKGVSLSVEKGAHLVIQGSSGSGKSTLLYLIGGLDRVDSGQITVGDKDLNKLNDEELSLFRNQSIGFIFQFHFLLPSMNCLDNILLPAQISGRVTKKLKEFVHDLAKRMDVLKVLKKYPYEISGGEQQRINIIRALSLNPEVLLCDEPTGNLDSKNSQVVIELIRSLSLELETSVILVTHDSKVANEFEHKITIEDGQIIS